MLVIQLSPTNGLNQVFEHELRNGRTYSNLAFLSLVTRATRQRALFDFLERPAQKDVVWELLAVVHIQGE